MKTYKYNSKAITDTAAALTLILLVVCCFFFSQSRNASGVWYIIRIHYLPFDKRDGILVTTKLKVLFLRMNGYFSYVALNFVTFWKMERTI